MSENFEEENINRGELLPNMERRGIATEMKTSFLDYAMSVIIARALPDVRDGLKPVHRRILYGMNELGVTNDKPFKKSARIVGDVMGKYHPHGDSAIYESMVRMAQDFSYRYMLVDGHGNFGSVDGDQAAAMRYTEARMSKISAEMLRDINKETVNFIPNYDGEEVEPEVLPARFPNLLVNGATGIAVGMTTNIPPHNLGEVISALHLLMKNPDISTLELMKAIPGPDFPTGGILLGKSGIRRAYETGKGRIIVRAKLDIESKNDRERIIVTEIPYMVNKAKLVERIAELAREKVVEGITAVRDESGRDGMRIVIECRRDASASVVVNNLYKLTQLQANFSFNMVAIVDGVPKTLSLKAILSHYLAHQEEVIRRRSIFEKKKAEARLHILEGLQIALDHIDAIVAILRSSASGDEAKAIFMEKYGLSDKQAQAILDMRLVRLTGLEREKIDSEHAKLLEEIAYLADILASESKRYDLIYEELLEIQERYNDERRTEIQMGELVNIDDEDLIEEEKVILTLTKNGYIKRLNEDEFRLQNRGGTGVRGMSMTESDAIDSLLFASSHDQILFFTDQGKVYDLKGFDIPEFGRQAKGLPIVNLLDLKEKEKVCAMIRLSADKIAKKEVSQLFFVTKRGYVKRTDIKQFENIRNSGLIALTLEENDELVSVLETNGQEDILLASHKGLAIRFKETDIRTMGRTARGVRGIQLHQSDYVIGATKVSNEQTILAVSERGYGKRTEASEYKQQKRGGKGVRTLNITQKNGPLVGLRAVSDEMEIMLMTSAGVLIRFAVNDISKTGRNTQGVRLMRLEKGAKVSALTLVYQLPGFEETEENNLGRSGHKEEIDGKESIEENIALPSSALKERLKDFAEEILDETDDINGESI